MIALPTPARNAYSIAVAGGELRARMFQYYKIKQFSAKIESLF